MSETAPTGVSGLTLLVMRHSKPEQAPPGTPDHDRQLTERGRKEARAAGTWVSSSGYVPDLILASSATRTEETAKLVASICDVRRVEYVDELYLAGAEGALEIVARRTPDDVTTAMVVGENPDMEYVSEYLQGEGAVKVRFRTSGIAVFALDVTSWADLKEGHGQLVTSYTGDWTVAEEAEEDASTVDVRLFSRSIHGARNRLGPGSIVTASAIAAELATDHGNLADGRLGKAPLRPEAGQRASTDDWLGRVASCYDPSVVTKTHHQVIDTKLALLALAALDAPVAEALSRHGVASWLRETVEVQPKGIRADPTEWSSDSPARIDELGRSPIAKDLAKRISRLAGEEQPEDTSFMVHIDGSWGAGKSSVFRFLRAELEDEFVVVDVNAWREQRVGVQWWTLFTALHAELERQTGPLGKWRLWLAGTADRIRANWLTFTIAAVLIVGAGIGALVGLDLTGGAAAADSVVKIVSLATLTFAGLAAVSKYAIPSSRRAAQGMWETSENPTREVARYFLRALRRAPKPVVFLIDDLDRCAGLYVVEFLEVVQTLVRDGPRLLDQERRSSTSGLAIRKRESSSVRRTQPSGPRRRSRQVVGPFVFVAADGAWIRASFEEHFKVFEGTFEKGRPLGYLFLEKLFQLHVRLPDVPPAARQAYLSRLLGMPVQRGGESAEQRDLVEEANRAVAQATSESAVLAAAEKATGISDPTTRLRVLGLAAEKFSDRAIEESPDHPLADFHPLLEPNPRSVKLFVNAYGVARSMLTMQEQFVAVEQLALWTVLEVRWPRLADYLRENPERASTLSDGPERPEDIKQLVAEPDVVRVISDDRWKGLGPERVRQCSGVS